MSDQQPLFSDFETTLMRQLISAASAFKGKTKPNPVVAAAVFKNNKCLSIGVHQRAGDDHAEVIALSSLSDCEGASIMVTLEPCTHYGKTPPCVEAIINAGIKDVIFASHDPNPLVQRVSAQQILEEAGVKVRVGLCATEAEALNKYYYHFHNYKRPYVLLKAATSLDGKIALASGESKYITSEESLRKVHEYRAQVDAIVIGQQTVLLDDASLSVRYNQLADFVNAPFKIILSTVHKIDPTHPVFNSEQGAQSIIVSQSLKSTLPNNALFWQLEETQKIDWDSILHRSYEMGIQSIMIEGGSSVFSSAINANIVDELLLFMAPKLIGEKGAKSVFEFDSISSLKDAYQLKDMSINHIGPDIFINAYF